MSKRSWVVVAMIFAPSLLAAQDRSLPDKLAPAARATLERLIDSARTTGVPGAPLFDKVSEGVLKGGDDDRIIRAVRTLARELSDARSVLGSSVDLPLLSAGASALHAGVSLADLRRIARPSGAAPDPATLTTALVTLVDLVAKRVPVALATSSIQSLVDRRANDRQFSELRNGVEQDILAGRAPDASVTARIKLPGATPP
ncbi:MAG TPA: hypothetical protein VGM82_20010 [Gemmatimonadaceae bacterium]|jgi:hypothetical protein